MLSKSLFCMSVSVNVLGFSLVETPFLAMVLAVRAMPELLGLVRGRESTLMSKGETLLVTYEGDCRALGR